MSHFNRFEWNSMQFHLLPAGWRGLKGIRRLAYGGGAQITLKVSAKQMPAYRGIEKEESLQLRLIRSGSNHPIEWVTLASRDEFKAKYVLPTLTYQDTHKIDAMHISGGLVAKQELGVVGIDVVPNYNFILKIVGAVGFVAGAIVTLLVNLLAD